jgi:hypothetical protein
MIKVLDNVTSTANVKYLESLMLDQPWYYIKNTAYNQFDTLEQKPYEASWVSMMYNNNEIMNPLMNLAHSVLIKALHDANISINKLIRIRAGLTTRTPFSVTHTPHVDWDSSHMSAIYYLNDSDGETIFYKEIWDTNLTVKSYDWVKERNFNILEKITPKADRIVIFDGIRFHSSTAPQKNNYRLTINFNWIS